MSDERGLYVVTPDMRAEPQRSHHLQLINRVEGDSFDTVRVINGLRGVCKTIDDLAADESDSDRLADLAAAAHVLSAILATRIV